MVEDPIAVPVIEPRSGLEITTILAQSGPVMVSFQRNFFDPDDHQWKPVTFHGVAVAVKNGDGEWHAKLFRSPRKRKLRSLFMTVARAWMAGRIDDAWPAPREQPS